MDIHGVALVIGAGNIGKEIALTLARHGANVLLCADINLEAAHQVVETMQQVLLKPGLDFEAHAIKVDVTDEASVQQMVDEVVTRHRRIDYFVNTSGFGAVGQTPLSSYSLNEYRKLDETHHIGTFLLLRAVTSCMIKQDPRSISLPGRNRPLSCRSESRGVIVIVASLASEGGYIGVAPYTAAKHAVKGLVKTSALENGSKHIRVNAVSPSYVRGPMMDKFLEESPGVKAGLLSDLPLGRLADPEEVADSVLFLCSGLSTYINGHTLIVDGGASVSLAKAILNRES